MARTRPTGGGDSMSVPGGANKPSPLLTVARAGVSSQFRHFPATSRGRSRKGHPLDLPQAGLARSGLLPAGKKWRSRRACYWLTLTSFTTPGSLPEVPPPLGRRLFLSDEHRHHLLQVLPFGAAGVALNFD